MVHAADRARGGFTLVEILVALVLIGLLVGALVPSVLNQLGRGDTNRAMEDLTAIENAVRAFRVDVRRWPGDIEDLVNEPILTGTSPDAALTNEGAYTPGLVQRWNGPYLERVTLDANGDVVSPLGGTIEGAFVSDAGHLVIEITGLGDDQIEELDLAIDGAAGQNAGRIRWTGSSGAFALRYYAVPLN